MSSRRRLEDAGHEEAALSAQVLLSKALSRPRAWLLAHPEAEIAVAMQAALQADLEQLASGVPLPYITGRQEFYGLDFEVSPQVLIPRPETELLIDRALAWLKSHPGRRAADVGTGSGCIAISLAVHCPDLALAAVDRSWAALQIARRNQRGHGVESRLHLFQSDLLSSTAGPFDLVCANLPYIPTNSLNGLPVARYEPRLALDGGADGLDLIAALLSDAHRWMAPSGMMLLEIEAGQGQSAPRLANHLLPQTSLDLTLDLAGLPRLLSIQFPSNE